MILGLFVPFCKVYDLLHRQKDWKEAYHYVTENKLISTKMMIEKLQQLARCAWCNGTTGN
jgi:hypothetical protein